MDVSWPIWPRSRSTGFKLAQDHYSKIPNESKVIAFTRNHTDDADEDDDNDRIK